MIFGYRDYIIQGEGYQKLYREIIKCGLPVRNMREVKGKLYLRISAEMSRTLEKICTESGCEFELKKSHGPINALCFLRSRPGIIVGFFLTAGLLVYMSNIALRFEVLSDNEVIQDKIMDSLEAQGITAGVYIPTINYTVVERNLRQDVEEISWAGITRQGNSLLIDVVENIEAPQLQKTRLPSNLIAAENGVIEKIEINDGQVVRGVGSGVTKGDVIVSGEIITTESSWADGKENIETRITYARSIGNVYGTFERTVTFEQPFEDRVEYETGTEKDISYLNFFDADIPLFAKMPEGYFKSETSVSSAEFLGFELPITVTSCHLTEYDFKTDTYTEEQARDILTDKVYKYETNFLSQYEIKDRQTEFEVTDTGIKETVTYSLYGVISKEAEFFIPK